jgi:hypothetical protein
MLRIAEGSELSKWFSFVGWIRLCHQAEKKVIRLKSRIRKPGKGGSSSGEKLSTNNTKSPNKSHNREGSSDSVRTDSSKFSNIFVRQSSQSSETNVERGRLDRGVGLKSDIDDVELDSSTNTAEVGIATGKTVGGSVFETGVDQMTNPLRKSKKNIKDNNDVEGMEQEKRDSFYLDGEKWTSYIDTVSREVYYHRELDGRTTWTNPKLNKIESKC